VFVISGIENTGIKAKKTAPNIISSEINSLIRSLLDIAVRYAISNTTMAVIITIATSNTLLPS